MASSHTECQHQEEDGHHRSSPTETSLFSHAWKSIRKHFPNSCVNKNTANATTSITFHPIHSIDLEVEFCFDEKRLQERPRLSVKSRKLSRDFVNELERILIAMCANLKDWKCLGDEIERILRCVEVKRISRSEKGTKKNKSSDKDRNRKKKLLPKSSLETDNDNVDDDVDVSSQDEVCVSLERIPVHGIDWKTFCEREEKKPRANYFIAVRIKDKNIIRNLSEVQNSLVNQEELLTKGVIPNETLHLTLCNLGLDSAQDLLSAIEAMNRMRSQLEDILPRTPFIVHGVSQFYNRAIYAKIKINEDFDKFRNFLVKNLEDTGVEFREDHKIFNPHVTIVKVRRPERRAFGTRNIESSLYVEYVDSVHGEQMVEGLCLCAMGGRKREDGFYVTACELDFNLG